MNATYYLGKEFPKETGISAYMPSSKEECTGFIDKIFAFTVHEKNGEIWQKRKISCYLHEYDIYGDSLDRRYGTYLLKIRASVSDFNRGYVYAGKGWLIVYDFSKLEGHLFKAETPIEY